MAAYFIAQYEVKNPALYQESTAAARVWYESPEYQAVVGKRLEATEGYAIISQSKNIGG